MDGPGQLGPFFIMALNARMTVVSTATTAAVGATNKVKALVTGTMDATIAEIGKHGCLTPNMQNKIAAMRADTITNIATLQTAVGL